MPRTLSIELHHAIGDVVTYDRQTLIVTASDSCQGCYFFKPKRPCRKQFKCAAVHRKDGTPVIFKKLDKRRTQDASRTPTV